MVYDGERVYTSRRCAHTQRVSHTSPDVVGRGWQTRLTHTYKGSLYVKKNHASLRSAQVRGHVMALAVSKPSRVTEATLRSTDWLHDASAYEALISRVRAGAIRNIVAEANMKVRIDLAALAGEDTWQARFEEKVPFKHIGGMRYNPKKFHAGFFKITKPLKAHFNIYGSGKVLCMGTKSTEDFVHAFAILAHRLKKVGVDATPESARICNVMASFKFGGLVDLDALTDTYQHITKYEDQKFPGAYVFFYRYVTDDDGNRKHGNDRFPGFPEMIIDGFPGEHSLESMDADVMEELGVEYLFTAGVFFKDGKTSVNVLGARTEEHIRHYVKFVIDLLRPFIREPPPAPPRKRRKRGKKGVKSKVVVKKKTKKKIVRVKQPSASTVDEIEEVV